MLMNETLIGMRERIGSTTNGGDAGPRPSRTGAKPSHLQKSRSTAPMGGACDGGGSTAQAALG